MFHRQVPLLLLLGILLSQTTLPCLANTEPVLCTEQNRGSCECSTALYTQTYVFTNDDSDSSGIGSGTRCFTVYTPPSATTPMPVLMHMDCYARNVLGPLGMVHPSNFLEASAKYGFAAVGLSHPDGEWTFGNDGIANAANPMPCNATDSNDIGYLGTVLQFIGNNTDVFDTEKIYTEGFSQNSMFAAYAAFCYSDKVAGVFQGGSGMALTDVLPYPPKMEGQCTTSAFKAYGPSCRTMAPCLECEMWPLYPCYEESHPIVNCLAAYVNDNTPVFNQTVDTSTPMYMYDALKAENHDGRLLMFSPNLPHIPGGHTAPRNNYDWIIGCLGVTETCSEVCEADFIACTQALEYGGNPAFAVPHTRFRHCRYLAALGSCASNCAPTFNMLNESETLQSFRSTSGNFGAGNSTHTAPRPGTSTCVSTGVTIPPHTPHVDPPLDTGATYNYTGDMRLEGIGVGDFNATRRDAFKYAMSESARVDVSRVEITQFRSPFTPSRRRHLLGVSESSGEPSTIVYYIVSGFPTPQAALGAGVPILAAVRSGNFVSLLKVSDPSLANVTLTATIRDPNQSSGFLFFYGEDTELNVPLVAGLACGAGVILLSLIFCFCSRRKGKRSASSAAGSL